MKNYLKLIFTGVCVSLLAVTTSCAGSKSPDKGYVADSVIEEQIVPGFTDMAYTNYHVEGNLNWRANEVIDFPSEVNKDFKFVAVKTDRENVSVSHYLGLPLKLGKDDYYFLDEEGELDQACTKYKMISKMYKINLPYNDTYYMYLENDGGFSCRSFGVNKIIRLIKRKGNKTTERGYQKGKWDIIAKYDKNGYLVYESFKSLNADSAPKEETCYGSATYTYTK